jgi:hypothetical protein
MKTSDKKNFTLYSVILSVMLICLCILTDNVFAQGTWSSISTTNAPSARTRHTAVWTGSKMIIWGGNPPYLNTGAAYELSTNSWTTTTTVNAPAMRSFHIAVWTGSKMIIWAGGTSAEGLNTGGLYDPVTNSWTPT